MGIKKYIVSLVWLFVTVVTSIADPGPRLVYQVQVSGLSGISTVEPIFDLSGNITSFVSSGSRAGSWNTFANPFVYLIDTLGVVSDSLKAYSDSITYFSDFQSAHAEHIGARGRVYVSYIVLDRRSYLCVDEIEFGLVSTVKQIHKVYMDVVSPGWAYDPRYGTGRDDIKLCLDYSVCNTQPLLKATFDVSTFNEIMHFYSEGRNFQTISVDLTAFSNTDTTGARSVITGNFLNLLGCDTLSLFSPLWYSDNNDSPGVLGDYSAFTTLELNGSIVDSMPDQFLVEAVGGDFDTDIAGDEILILGVDFKVNNFKSGVSFAALYNLLDDTMRELWRKPLSGKKMVKDAKSDFVAVLNNYYTIGGSAQVSVYSIRPDYAGVAQTITMPQPLYYADIVQSPDGNSPLYLVGTDSNTIYVYDLSIITDADTPDESVVPDQFALNQNYPNPFNPKTAIAYSLNERSDVKIEVFNLTGQLVDVLIDQPQGAGSYRLEWDGRDQAGNEVASGLYFYRLSTNQERQTKKMMLVR